MNKNERSTGQPISKRYQDTLFQYEVLLLSTCVNIHKNMYYIYNSNEDILPK